MPFHRPLRNALLVFALFAASFSAVGGVEQSARNEARRESLRLVAFDGRCAVYVAAAFRELSPSVTEVELWRTCWGGLVDPLFDTKAGSSISSVRMDCGTRQFATVESASFEKQFWQGRVVQARELKPLWKALTSGFTELQRLCLPNDDVRRHTTAFDGPGSKLGE